ncbi:MAG: rhodanese-like domain-containing protein [bacterium]|nr:rhodanese-like domain-containing protein [bacterium]
MMRQRTLLVPGMLVLVLLAAGSWATDFPNRSKYDDVAYISIEELEKRHTANNIVVVDVRSKLEFDTIHMEGAQHIPLASDEFEQLVRDLRESNPAAGIAFYCNGVTCLKSYEAARKAGRAGIQDTYAFDLGIPGWAEMIPSKTVLMGKPMDRSATRWIPKSEFKETSLAWPDFLKLAARTREEGKKLYVIDFRDDVQKGILSERALAKLTPKQKAELEKFQARNAYVLSTLNRHGWVIAQPLDKFIENVVSSRKMQDGRIIGFDQVGKQVRWLMYYLEEAGYSDYVFLDQGISSVIESQVYAR